MPFRLTPNILELGLPFSIEGTFKYKMLEISQILNTNKQILFDYIEVYINEPLVDWQALEIKDDINNQQFINQRIQVFKAKINGKNPLLIIQEEFKNSQHRKSEHFQSILNVL